MGWSVTSEFRAWLVRSHNVAVRLDVLAPDGQVLATLPQLAISGEVTVARADIQRQATLTLVDADRQVSPSDASDLLDARSGHQLRVWSGIAYPDLDPTTGYSSYRSELVPVGTLRITRSDLSYPRLTLTLKDRAWIIAKAQLDHVYAIPSGSNTAAAVQTLIGDRYGQPLEFRFEQGPQLTPLVVLDVGADPWAQAQDLALGLGKRLWFDPMGVCVLAADPDPATATPDWTYSDDALQESPLLAEPVWSLDTEDAVNAVVCTAESGENDTPLRGSVYDLDPASPLRWGGPFGKFPAQVSVPTATTQAMADAAARQHYASVHGIDGIFELEGISNPALEVGDVIAAQSAREGVAASFSADGFNVALDGGRQRIAARLRRAVSF